MRISKEEMINSGEHHVPGEGPNYKKFWGKVPKLGCQICKSENAILTGIDRNYTKGESPITFVSWKCLENDCGFIWGEYFRYLGWATNDNNQQIIEK